MLRSLTATGLVLMLLLAGCGTRRPEAEEATPPPPRPAAAPAEPAAPAQPAATAPAAVVPPLEATPLTAIADDTHRALETARRALVQARASFVEKQFAMAMENVDVARQGLEQAAGNAARPALCGEIEQMARGLRDTPPGTPGDIEALLTRLNAMIAGLGA